MGFIQDLPSLQSTTIVRHYYWPVAIPKFRSYISVYFYTIYFMKIRENYYYYGMQEIKNYFFAVFKKVTNFYTTLLLTFIKAGAPFSPYSSNRFNSSLNSSTSFPAQNGTLIKNYIKFKLFVNLSCTIQG